MMNIRSWDWKYGFRKKMLTASQKQAFRCIRNKYNGVLYSIPVRQYKAIEPDPDRQTEIVTESPKLVELYVKKNDDLISIISVLTKKSKSEIRRLAKGRGIYRWESVNDISPRCIEKWKPDMVEEWIPLPFPELFQLAERVKGWIIRVGKPHNKHVFWLFGKYCLNKSYYCNEEEAYDELLSWIQEKNC